MSAASDLLESRLGTYFLLTSMPTKPPAFWIALYKNFDFPSEDNEDGQEIPRTSFSLPTGYARVRYDPGDERWAESANTPGLFYNKLSITFPDPIRPWGIITNWAIHDDEFAGNVWVTGGLSIRPEVNQGDPAPVFAPGAITITFA